MPATEQIWRNTKTLHMWFVVASVVMLVSTVWMLAVDHNREWKQYQRTFRDIEVWTTKARQVEENTQEYRVELSHLETALVTAESTPPAAELVDRFVIQVLYRRFEEQSASQAKRMAPDFEQLGEIDLDELGEEENRKWLDKIIKTLRARLDLEAANINAEYEKVEALSKRLIAIQQRIARIGEADPKRAASRRRLLATEEAKVAAELGAARDMLFGPARRSLFSDSYEGVAAASDPAVDTRAKFTKSKKTADDWKELRAVEREVAAAAAPAREELFTTMREIIERVKFEESGSAKDRKFRRANLDAAKSRYDLGVRDGVSPDRLDEVRKNEIEKIAGSPEDADPKSIAGLTDRYETAADQRQTLQIIYDAITEQEQFAHQNLNAQKAQLEKLQAARDEREAWWGRLLEFPIVDAFNSPIGLEQIWLPDLTKLNGGFGQVARFDRCISCHLAIDKTAPGRPLEPGFPARESPQQVVLETPSVRPESQKDRFGNKVPVLEALYGIRLAERELFSANDVTVEVVWPNRPGAVAGLRQGDVIKQIRVGDRNEKLEDRSEALRYLVHEVEWGKPLVLTVLRGFPHPFSTHPRLELYGASIAAHSFSEGVGKIGCTICHEGQGSATAFKWASHTPNSQEQADEWAEKHGWFDNHHWTFPMRPKRFIESSCLKCHHEVAELAASRRFPDPPAPKLMQGYDLVRGFGCFGCHEINGYDGPDLRIGPDFRTEPPFHAAGRQIANEFLGRVGIFKRLLDQSRAQAGPNVTTGSAMGRDLYRGMATMQDMKKLADRLTSNPADDEARHGILRLLEADSKRAKAPTQLLADRAVSGRLRTLVEQIKKNPLQSLGAREKVVATVRKDAETDKRLRLESHELAASLATPPYFSEEARRLSEVLKDSDTPGRMRKVGPSLRHVRWKLGPQTLTKWILDPGTIRPTTTMPRFFGLHTHLSKEAKKSTPRFEEIEARAIAEYLIARSQTLDHVEKPRGVTQLPDPKRGKLLFKIRGCLACHQHADFPAGTAIHGPNLSDLARKITTRFGRSWLYTWLKDPSRYHRRTVMPNMLLDPVIMKDAQGKRLVVTGPDGREMIRKYDPVADISAFLLGSSWKPVVEKLPQLDPPQVEVLSELSLEYLKKAFPTRAAKAYLEQGIPPNVARTLKGAEVELGVPAKITNPENPASRRMMIQRKLLYVGKKSISRLGCFGCHDIPGFETAKPIGTALAEWGRKESSKLDFAHILEYLPKEQHVRSRASKQKHGSGDHKHEPNNKKAAHVGHHEHLNPEKWGDDGFFIKALLGHHREGFLWQKLREPRGYDYEKADNKDYTDRLRMPQFNWGGETSPAVKRTVETAFRENLAKKQGIDPEDVELELKDEKRLNEEIQAAVGKVRDEQIEAVMTFVLGLVAEPPATKYVYHPDDRSKAMIAGEKVLDRFYCAGCHVLELDRWKIRYKPGDFEAPEETVGYAFMQPRFDSEAFDKSKNTDERGDLHAMLTGMLIVNEKGHPDVSVYLEEDEEFVPLAELEGEEIDPSAPRGYPIELWEPVVLEGHVFKVKTSLPTVSSKPMPGVPSIERHYPARGGKFAWMLLPEAIKLEKRNAGGEAWAWGPPPLVNQGKKTRPEWLHDFLLNPKPIRLGVILRMPKFNMSSAESTALVEYFAARDQTVYPYQFNIEKSGDHLAAEEADYQAHLAGLKLSGRRLDDVLKIVLESKNGCVQCHKVGDFVPQQTLRQMGPNLADVHKRLQADYVRRWIAKPDALVPYTKMPVNFPFDPDETKSGFFIQVPVPGPDGKPKLDDEGKPVTEPMRLYHGGATEQLDALVDLLMNFDRFLSSKNSVSKMMRPPQETNPK